jgi:hypothetical protein
VEWWDDDFGAGWRGGGEEDWLGDRGARHGWHMDGWMDGC